MPRSRTQIRDEELRKNAAPYDWSRHSLTDAEVRQFALELYRNEIFTECMVHPQDKHLLGMIFMPLMFEGPSDPELRGSLEKSPVTLA